MEILDFILNNWVVITQGVAALLTVATVITGLTPSPVDDGVVAKIRTFLRTLGIVTHKDEPSTFKFPLVK